MSMAQPADQSTLQPTPEVRGSTADSFGEAKQIVQETKPSYMTTEFWAMIVGLVALIIIYNVTDDQTLTLWRTCLLGSLIGGSYVVSRGLAKSGSRMERWTDDRHR